MTLHRLASITMGVPNVADTADYYTDFGLTPSGGGRFATTDGGEQLRIVASPTRRLVTTGSHLKTLGPVQRARGSLHTRRVAQR